ncbi:hypothetical protein [Haladaptatus halobius]|uniref:hypothetical protein n=1 Tax=Haladaptatus halobius TaxID=2884875 RepID=UPI001D0A1386|nr:hypothetical protein [Haladaptatus halobius]
MTEAHVREARTEAEKDRFKELIEEVSQQAKAVLLALSILTNSSNQEEFATQLVYRQYSNICKIIDLDTLSERRFRDILNEQTFLGLIDIQKENRGRSGGINLLNRLVEDSETVYQILIDDNRFTELDDNLDQRRV